MMIRYTLWKLARRARPDAAFIARLGSRFAPHKIANYAMRLAASLTALVLSLGLGTSAYAYSSDDVTPDNPLYPVRTAVENVAVAAAVTPTLKRAVQQTMVKRRLHEIQVLETRRTNVRNQEEEQTLKRVETVLKDGLKNQEAPDEIRAKAADAIKQTDVSQLRPLQRLRIERLKSRLDDDGASEHD